MTSFKCCTLLCIPGTSGKSTIPPVLSIFNTTFGEVDRKYANEVMAASVYSAISQSGHSFTPRTHPNSCLPLWCTLYPIRSRSSSSFCSTIAAAIGTFCKVHWVKKQYNKTTDGWEDDESVNVDDKSANSVEFVELEDSPGIFSTSFECAYSGWDDAVEAFQSLSLGGQSSAFAPYGSIPVTPEQECEI